MASSNTVKAMPLAEFIEQYFNGRQVDFAAAQRVEKPSGDNGPQSIKKAQVTKWLNGGFYVLLFDDGSYELFSPRRKLSLKK